MGESFIAMAQLALALPPPLLHEGDQLSALEFLHRWEAMPDLKEAELLNGVVFLMASPIGKGHSRTHGRLHGWLWSYAESTPGCETGIAGTWLMSAKDVPQPDLTLSILPEHGGQSAETGLYPEGAPELIVEISGSSTSRDLGVKLELYRSAGVREYVTVLLNPQKIIWRHLSRGRYKELVPGDDGWLRSQVFPGLWLDPAAVWDRTASLRAALEPGLRSPEHEAFVARLAKPKPRRKR